MHIIKPFQHIAFLQQTTLKTIRKFSTNEGSTRDVDKTLLSTFLVPLIKRIENIVAKGEIACFYSISPFVTVFSKVVGSRGVRKRLYVWKEFKPFINPFPHTDAFLPRLLQFADQSYGSDILTLSNILKQSAADSFEDAWAQLWKINLKEIIDI